MTNNQQKSRKRTLVKRLLISVIFFISIIVAYSIYQYNDGLSNAREVYEKDENDFDSFEGEEIQFGEMKVLLIGNDAREGEQGRSDTLMIAYYNQHTNQIKLASLMRDMYVEIPEYGMQKLNAAFAFGGPELVRKTIKHNFDIDVNYYAVVDFSGFTEIVDLIAPKGIEVDIPEEMSTGIGMTLHPGKQTLSGEEVLGYVRFRKDNQGDFGRVERQQEVLSKIKDEALSVENIIHLPKIIGTADPYIDTNVDKQTLLSIAKGLVSTDSHEIKTLRIPLDDSYTDEHVDVGAVLSVDLEENKQKLIHFFFEESSVAHD
ncbi:LCP family protein [Pseudogracilibacillus auburnensis]|uniref:LCP family protein n=1 Tax=Pseudogracilibacillus auburnensis TaxID=1494959 RepID=UPI001A96192A|nr:LCP family protein [Pseudogracilibacillus auburnensis]MBO1001318.1 LCP family protein [Pseudogracilibacillus auburnensis]